ncbi:MAG: hypothetical protein OXF26_08275 [Alphaproteobacteria bacterium]|nr:hypothetical protein [Alphaproteobacteria bacterium]MCY4230853.1 hypothetical protein [Alphaproteobacteria bacterium]
MYARRVFLILAGLLGAMVAAGVLYFGLVDSPPPEAVVEKVLPDDRLPR